MKLARLWVIVLCASTYASAQIKDDWPSYNGDYTGKRFSGLTQITPQNVGHLQAQWVFHTKTPGVLEATFTSGTGLAQWGLQLLGHASHLGALLLQNRLA